MISRINYWGYSTNIISCICVKIEKISEKTARKSLFKRPENVNYGNGI